MTLAARTLARIAGFVLLVLLALAGLAAMVFAIQGDDATLSYPQLADWLALQELREEAGDLYARLEEDGPVAIVTLLAGLAAVLLGLVLIAGALLPRRERRVTLEQAGEGTIAARRGPLARTAEALAGTLQGVARARARVVPGRLRGGRLKLRADLTRPTAASHGARASREAIERRLAPLTEAFHLRPKVSTRTGEGRARVR